LEEVYSKAGILPSLKLRSPLLPFYKDSLHSSVVLSNHMFVFVGFPRAGLSNLNNRQKSGSPRLWLVSINSICSKKLIE
jgi:hypothetical protein